MTLSQLLFLAFAALVLFGAFMVVASRNLIHMALYLILTLMGVSALFALLEAGFLAVVQVVIYVGAIATLIIFAIMLTRRDLVERGAQSNRLWPIAALFSTLLFAGLAWLLLGLRGVGESAGPLPAGDPVRLLGVALLAPDQFMLPFEVASVLLLAALIGAIVIAGEPRK